MGKEEKEKIIFEKKKGVLLVFVFKATDENQI